MSAISGCDPGPATDAPRGVGPAIHIVSANVSAGKMLPANGSIQLAFDRLLLPESITRQTFLLNVSPPVLPSYDPVTRIVTISPQTPLVVGQSYELAIASPQSDTDPNGLRAIDGATLDPTESVVAFMVSAPIAGSTPATVDFCQSVQPIFASCSGNSCHGGYLPASGLELTTNAFVTSTAVGKVAHGSNRGPNALPSPPGLRFGQDMPIIDPGTAGAGDPGNSWLLYKLLLAQVPAGSAMPGPFAVQWQPLSAGERTILGTFVTGREMPYPAAIEAGVGAPDAGADGGWTLLFPAAAQPGLNLGQIDTISLWIAQGATVPPSCP